MIYASQTSWPTLDIKKYSSFLRETKQGRACEHIHKRYGWGKRKRQRKRKRWAWPRKRGSTSSCQHLKEYHGL